MEGNKQEPEKEFQFIREKVIPKRKNKVKRYLIMIINTVLFAALFGLIARYVFIESEDWMCDLLGIDTSGRKMITFPSAMPSLTPTIAPTPTPPPPTPTPVEEDQKEPVIVEQKIEATAQDYIKMLADIRKVADKVNHSIVTITAIESGIDWSDTVYETKQVTTGVIIGENNVDILILTQLDQVRGATKTEVTFSNGTTTEAVLWNSDIDYNAAILAVSLENLNETTLNSIEVAELGESYLISLGMPVLALGNPNGYAGSIELGMVTRRGIYKSVVDNRLELFQMDMINHENSGGIITNLEGEVVGWISQTLNEEKNIFTAIGISKLKPVIERLANKTDCIYLGIYAEDVPKDVLKEAEIECGIYINEIETNSPALKYGLQRGDIITSIDDIKVTSVGTLANILTNYKSGDTVNIKVRRMVKQIYKDVEVNVILKVK